MPDIIIDLTRESVCAGDDVDSLHAASVTVSVLANSRDPIGDAIYTALNTHNYLPSVAGSSTWIAHCMGQCFVFNHGSGRHDIRNWQDVDPTALQDRSPVDMPTRLTVELDYYLSNNVDRIVKQLRAGQMPERIYGGENFSDIYS